MSGCTRRHVSHVSSLGDYYMGTSCSRKQWNPGCPHPMMQDVHRHNDEFLRFRAARLAPIADDE